MEQHIKIAVIGGTGKAGKYLVNQLVNNGFNSKVLLRNPDKLEITSHLIEKVTGDVRNYESVYSLIEGCSAVISTLGQTKGESPVFSQATVNIIKAMNALNVHRYIMITGLTLDTIHDNKSFRTRLLSKIMKLSFPDIIADKQKEYSFLSASNLNWTVIRLPVIKQTKSSGEIKISLTDCPGKIISSTDLANFLISQLSDDNFIRKTPFIAN
ncbi:MAG TPA: SDR family oxidoreductase [Bacteroidales bacterium]|nr:SDR family oxidoreductase [Bacteroidales bacterium]